MPPLVFTPEEATAVYLGTGLVEEIWGSLYRAAAQGALAKLDNVLPDEQRQEVAWAAAIAGGDWDAPRRPGRAGANPRKAAPGRVRAAAHRHALPQQQSPRAAAARDLDPYALVHRWGWWYAIGFCHLRQEVRSFRVDRMVELALSSQVFQAPNDFDVHTYLAEELQDQPKLQATFVFRLSGSLRARSNRSSWEVLEEQPDGSVVVSLLTARNLGLGRQHSPGVWSGSDGVGAAGAAPDGERVGAGDCRVVPA